jgi:subtilisin family serine protease
MIGSTRWSKAATRLLVLGAMLALPSSALAAGEQPLPAGPPTTPRDAGALDRIIVEWEPGTTSDQRLNARDDADTGFVRTLGRPSFQLVRPDAGQSVADALDSLRDDPNVRSAERDTFSVLHATTNDPLFGQLWGLQNLGLGIDGSAGAVADDDIDAPRAWDRTRGSSSVVIADLDTGYRFDHPDLALVAWTNSRDPTNGADDDGNGIVDDTHGADFVGTEADSPTTDGNPTDDNLTDGGHGVHTAGTIGAAGNNGVGISGVAQDVRIMPLRVCAFSTSADETRCPTSSQILAINYAGAHGARAANMSLGGTTFSTALRDAFASNPRTLFVISAGNDAKDNDPGGTPHYPCAYDPSTSAVPGAIDNIVCVAATDQADALASFSDYGARTVDLGAPGTEILSTYPWATHVHDDFSVDDFASKWTATGADGGFARTNEAPLTSFGMSDSPGATPVANSVHESTSTAVTIPAGYTHCRISQSRTVSLGGGVYTYSVLLNGSSVASSSPSSSGNFFLNVTSGLSGGGSLQLRFRYTAGPAPTSGDGVWLDNIDFTCAQPVGQTTGYGFLDGTSMAAPHVTGAAGLLFSLDPSATVSQVQNALLSSVDPDPALVGKTVTGGRLNVADALDALSPPPGGPPAPDTAITSVPTSGTTSTSAQFAFARSGDVYATSFECQLDGGAFQACASPAGYAVGVGAHTFAVRARSKFGVADPTPASVAWTVVAQTPPGDGGNTPPPPPPASRRCVVPRLKGLSLTRAKAKLRAAHCALGRVTKPRARRGHRLPPLVVKSSKPGAHATGADGMRVALTLAPKPRARRRARRR